MNQLEKEAKSLESSLLKSDPLEWKLHALSMATSPEEFEQIDALLARIDKASKAIESDRARDQRLRDEGLQRDRDEDIARRWVTEQERKEEAFKRQEEALVEALSAAAPSLQATESRLLTRGPSDAASKAQTTREKQLQAQEEANKKLDKLIDDNRGPNQLKVEVIA